MKVSEKETISELTHETDKRAADEICNKFVGLIQSGQLADGAPLPTEREIVERFGVSRTVVREAILALSNKGLIDAKPRHRPIVKKPDFGTVINAVESIVGQLLNQPDGVKNLFDTRIMVEVSLVRQMALEANREVLEELRAALHANGESIDDSEEFYRTDKKFHEVFHNVSGNPIIVSVNRAYTTWLAPYWSKMPRLPERNRLNFKSHEGIFEAILMRDPDKAEKILRSHLADSWEQVKLTFED